MTKRRTQAERREATQAKLLSAARYHFGEFGYGATSLDDIAAACDVTVRPIYHYFESKLGLFTAVSEQIESEIIDSMQSYTEPSVDDVWQSFMARCEDAHFRQIFLIDGPAVLGRKRMMRGVIADAARERTAEIFERSANSLSMNMLMGALSNAALYIAEHGATPEDYETIRKLINFHSGKAEK